jgi:hypothetical protein
VLGFKIPANFCNLEASIIKFIFIFTKLCRTNI